MQAMNSIKGKQSTWDKQLTIKFASKYSCKGKRTSGRHDVFTLIRGTHGKHGGVKFSPSSTSFEALCWEGTEVWPPKMKEREKKKKKKRNSAVNLKVTYGIALNND